MANELTKSTTGGAVATSKPVVIPARVASGIKDLLLAFPAGAATAPDDRVRQLQLYAEATALFEPLVAAHALKALRLANPRNPFPPTPQDVADRCVETRRSWVAEAWDGRMPDGVDSALIDALLRTQIASMDANDLHRLSPSKFARIEHLIDGELLASIEAIRQREASIAAQRSYLASLPENLRVARGIEFQSMIKRGEDLTEDELLARARMRLAEGGPRRPKPDNWLN